MFSLMNGDVGENTAEKDGKEEFKCCEISRRLKRSCLLQSIASKQLNQTIFTRCLKQLPRFLQV